MHYGTVYLRDWFYLKSFPSTVIELIVISSVSFQVSLQYSDQIIQKVNHYSLSSKAVVQNVHEKVLNGRSVVAVGHRKRLRRTWPGSKINYFLSYPVSRNGPSPNRSEIGNSECLFVSFNLSRSTLPPCTGCPSIICLYMCTIHEGRCSSVESTWLGGEMGKGWQAHQLKQIAVGEQFALIHINTDSLLLMGWCSSVMLFFQWPSIAVWVDGKWGVQLSGLHIGVPPRGYKGSILCCHSTGDAIVLT